MTPDADQDFIAQALPAFVSEAREQIEHIEQLLLQLEDAPGDHELLGALFRCAHTVKGSAGLFGLAAVVGFTHHVESLLDRLREGELTLTPELGTLLLHCNDQIRELVDAASTGCAEAAEVQSRGAALIARLQAAGSAAAAPPSAACAAPREAQVRRWQIGVRFGADTYRNGMDPLAILLYLRGLGTVGPMVCDSAAVPGLEAIDPEGCCLGFEFTLDTAATRAEIEAAFSFVRDDCELRLTEPQAAAAAAPQPPAPRPRETAAPAADEHRYIRVQADRLDAVINLLGELVIAGAGASLLAHQTRHGALIEANAQIGRLIEEIRNGTLQLRMVPIGETFARFRRVVRDTAAELGKDVALEIVGADTELDKSVVERIADPLMHLVRNALDHGLETPQQRAAAGKPPQGRLTLAACHESGSILIRIRDDGRGIDRERVLARARERGLIEADAVLSDDAVARLIFEPGFSTAEKVTNLSGRGVGMDVVKRNIEALRGTVCVFSEAGRGSCIEIRLPLTLAIIDGFLVGVGSTRFVFPLDGVVEVIEGRATAHALDAGGRGVIELRGQALPVLSLRCLYGLDGSAPERSSVVVIQAGARRYGVLVDQLLGQHQTVIKPLGRMFRSLRGMSGSSILGSGEVALIFDVNGLADLAAAAAARAESLAVLNT